MKLFRHHIFILFTASILTSLNSNAQPFFDVFKCDYGTSYFNPVNESEFEFKQFDFQFNAGVKVKGDNRILFGATAERQSSDVRYFINGDHVELYSAALVLGYLHFNENKIWRTIGQVRIRNQGDEFKIHPDHFQYGGWLLTTYKRKTNLSYMLGGYYNSEFYGSAIYPLLGIDWQPSERTSLYVLAPSFARFEYAVRPNNIYGAIEIEQNKSSFDIRATTRLDHYLRHEIIVQPVIEYVYVEKIILFGSFGYFLKSAYELYDVDGSKQNRPQLDNNLNSNWNFKVGMAYRLRYKNK